MRRGVDPWPLGPHSWETFGWSGTSAEMTWRPRGDTGSDFLVLCRCGSSESWQTRSARCARVPDPRAPDRSGLLVVGDNTDQNLLVTWTWTYVNSGWQARSEPSDRLGLRRPPLPAPPQE